MRSENVSPSTHRERKRAAGRIHGRFCPNGEHRPTQCPETPLSPQACVYFARFGSCGHMHTAGKRDWKATTTSTNQAHSSSRTARVCLVSRHPASCSRVAMALQMQQMQMQQQQLQQHQLQQQQMQVQQLQHQQLQQQQLQQQQMQQLQQQRQMQQMQQHPQMQQQPHMQQNQANFGGAKGGAGCKGGMPGKGGQGPARPPAPPPPPGAPGAQPRPTGPGLTVTGCNNDTVRNLINGSYSVTGENHGKPMWKKDLRLQPECLASSFLRREAVVAIDKVTSQDHSGPGARASKPRHLQ
ncbi:unnamed protein product [Symbiodinium sp. CCMP2456]|nr:unnamed protein product [Symbiodinium sp. CCMP2456]